MKSITGVGRARARIVPVLLLFAASAHGAAHDGLYLRFGEALDLYLRVADDGGWPTVPDGPTIEPGSGDPRVESLAKRLAITGDLASHYANATVYDDALQAAVKRFQVRHGLEADALVGRNTLHALNVPAEKRVAQLRLNMERYQQAFADAGPDFLFVNVPSFEARLVRNGEAVTTTRVIVGETNSETPLFATQMKQVVINPTWSVPYSIASEELLPKIQRDPDFLSRGGYDVFDRAGNRVDPARIDWASLHRNNFPYALRQRPGSANELGRIKFLFPNDYGVCMHDTPGKHLFARDSRAFSHGCIRVDDPIGFAENVLEPEGWTRDRIVEQLASGRTFAITLAEPVPVIVAYLTAWVDESGTVYFYRDIYGRDGG